jgi:hypothetical protein
MKERQGIHELRQYTQIKKNITFILVSYSISINNFMPIVSYRYQLSFPCVQKKNASISS